MKKLGISVGIVVLILGFVSGGFVLGYRIGERNPRTVIIRGVAGMEASSTPIDFSVFWEAWDKINNEYLKSEQIEPRTKVYGAIQGLVESLGDPHSVFFSPEDGKKFSEDVEGNFGGIGAEIGVRKDQVVVIAPLKGSPAFRAGLQPNDAILFVGATSTEGLNVDQVVRMIRGPKGTEVSLMIVREGLDRPKEFKMIRETILVPTLDFEMKGDIAHIELHGFNLNSNSLFSDAVIKALSRGARGMVLDLRNNPGGYLDVAVDLAGWFLPRGTLVVSEATRDGVVDKLLATGNASLTKFPVVVLVNGGSASASEILAGALRDERKVKLIGEKTFGKGTVQQIMDLSDGSSMKLTIAHWVMPSGKILEQGGIEPDIEVKPSEADIDSGNDVQLTKALEVIQTEIRAAE